ncbi:MAG: glycosyltransferase [Candidatus Zixiibacteriota bacterium]
MNEQFPAISIIVINYNTPNLVENLIKSIVEFTRQIDYEIVVVNNGCREAGKFGAGSSKTFVRIIDSAENLGFARAANIAATASEHDFLLFANSDCSIDSNVIPRLVKFLLENSQAAACSPRTVSPDGQTHSSIRRFPTHANIRASRGAFIRRGDDYTLPADDARKAVEAMAATFMMVRRERFRAVNGFDERFFMFVEDTDLCKKFHDSGKSVWYLGDINVTHIWGASTRQHRLKMKYHHHLSIWKYFRKYYPAEKLANLWLAVQLTANFLLVAAMSQFRPGRSHS